MKADFIALATVSAFVAALAWLVPASYVPHRVWPFVFAALLTGTWIWSRHPNAPTNPRAWSKHIKDAAIAAAILIPSDALSFGLPRWHVVMYFLVMGSVVITAAGGLARSLARGEQNQR